MTDPIDLEALRAALDAINDGKGTCEFEGDMVTAERLDDAHYTVELALAELTARRARDAEVAKLVEVVADMLCDHPEARTYPDGPCIEKQTRRELKAALLPFQRSDDKGDAT